MILRIKTGRYPIGIWIALLAVLLTMVGMLMQLYSLLDWEHAVKLGFQNERFSTDPVESTWAAESWGVAMADVLWPLPITLIAFVGLLRRRFVGFAAALMALAIAVYFPLVFAFQRWQVYPGTVWIAIVMWVVPALLGIAALWMNRDWFRVR